MTPTQIAEACKRIAAELSEWTDGDGRPLTEDVAALRAAAETVQGMEWRTMESAPRDGSYIVVLRHGLPITVRWREDSRGWDAPYGSLYLMSEEGDDAKMFDGWHPVSALPAPPEGK